jgi:hypothetical protein
MARDTDSCVEILGDCGLLLLDFLHVPHGLNAREWESYPRATIEVIRRLLECRRRQRVSRQATCESGQRCAFAVQNCHFLGCRCSVCKKSTSGGSWV